MRRERNADGLTEKEFLKQYNPGKYEKPSVTVDNLLFSVDQDLSSLKILLIKRDNHPYIDCWALPGGFVNIDESAHVAANRELYEETGLKDIYLEQLYTYTQPGRDPRMRVIDIAYIALIPMSEAIAGDDASDAAWFSVSMDKEYLILENEEKNVSIKYKLENKTFESGMITYDNMIATLVSEDMLAFDHYMEILDGINRIRNKAEYTDIAFNLMKEEFTLPDLQRTYELILGKTLYKKNFNDKIVNKVVATGNKIKSIRGEKLANGYRYRKGKNEEG